MPIIDIKQGQIEKHRNQTCFNIGKLYIINQSENVF